MGMYIFFRFKTYDSDEYFLGRFQTTPLFPCLMEDVTMIFEEVIDQPLAKS
jgi:hypothetical protein